MSDKEMHYSALNLPSTRMSINADDTDAKDSVALFTELQIMSNTFYCKGMLNINNSVFSSCNYRSSRK